MAHVFLRRAAASLSPMLHPMQDWVHVKELSFSYQNIMSIQQTIRFPQYSDLHSPKLTWKPIRGPF